jgi:hypothetical protein
LSVTRPRPRTGSAASYEAIQTAADDLTIRGHANGTVLRGGDPSTGQQLWGLVLRGGGHTVEALTFESFVHSGLFLGDYASGVGGSMVRNSAFVANAIGVIVAGRDAAATVIQDNDFIDNGSAIFVDGGRANFVRNEVHAPDPTRVPDAPGDYPPLSLRGGHDMGGSTLHGSGHGGTLHRQRLRDDNEVADNQFPAIEGWQVVLDGDRNSVQLTSATDSVLDLGTDNQVSHPLQQIAGRPPAVAKLRMIRRLQRLIRPPSA